MFGSGAYAVKSYNSKVDHHELVFSFDLFTVDSWDNEIFKVLVDDIEVYTFTAVSSITTPRTVSCGIQKFLDRISTVAFVVPHYRRDFTVKFTSTLDSSATDESWGIRNL